jgi:hypothetical protein
VSLEDGSDDVVHLTTLVAQYLPEPLLRLLSCLGGYPIGHDSFSSRHGDGTLHRLLPSHCVLNQEKGHTMIVIAWF